MDHEEALEDVVPTAVAHENIVDSPCRRKLRADISDAAHEGALTAAAKAGDPAFSRLSPAHKQFNNGPAATPSSVECPPSEDIISESTLHCLQPGAGIRDAHASTPLKEKYAEWQHTLQHWRKQPRDWKVLRSGGVKDVAAAGCGVPLFINFYFEDWALLNIRVELHLLIHAVNHNATDHDRHALPLDHLSLYYYKGFGKPFTISDYGLKEVRELVAILQDTVWIDDNKLLTCHGTSTVFEHFIKLAVTWRCDRSTHFDVQKTLPLSFSPSLLKVGQI
jgi:hypothetical protein